MSFRPQIWGLQSLAQNFLSQKNGAKLLPFFEMKN